MSKIFERITLIPAAEPFDGPMQMAIDEVLCGVAARPLLRIYRWAAPAVTFGYAQRHALVEASAPGLPATRRWTGGGIVRHGGDLTFCVISPIGTAWAALAPRASYRALHAALLGAIREVEPDARLAGEGEVVPGEACFVSPAQSDVLVGPIKVLGGAQRRTKTAMLYQGSLQNMNLPEDFAGRMASALAPRHDRGVLADDVTAAARDLAVRRYADPAWTRAR